MNACEDCGRFASPWRVVTEDESGAVLCESCRDNRNEAAYERQQEGECFCGGEAAAFMAEEQERARRLK